ncbi:Plasmodium exported protein, unknown function [Plasmodium yoelii]|uniref:Uncharacterized protein n=1 Tax=Plasmodium yoelii TaxID=5861 RepID=A0A077Y0K7_PLAYE|nr:Plasmodium exported protein, unknown function [Plasmodium yoelii]
MANIWHPTPKHAMNRNYGKNESNKNLKKKKKYIPLSVAYLIKLCKCDTIKILSIINMLYLYFFLIWTTNSFNYRENYYDKPKNVYSTVYNRLLADAKLLMLGNNPVTNSVIDNKNSNDDNLLLEPFLKEPRSLSLRARLKRDSNKSIDVIPMKYHHKSSNESIKTASNRSLTKSPTQLIKATTKGFIKVFQKLHLTKSQNELNKTTSNSDLTKSSTKLSKTTSNRDINKSLNELPKTPTDNDITKSLNELPKASSNTDITKSSTELPEAPTDSDITKSSTELPKTPTDSDITKSSTELPKTPTDSDITKSSNKLTKPSAYRNLTKSPTEFIKMIQKRHRDRHAKLNKNESTETISNISKEILQTNAPNSCIYIHKMDSSESKLHLSGNASENLKSDAYNKTNLDNIMKMEIPIMIPPNPSSIKGETSMTKNTQHDNNKCENLSLLKVVQEVTNYTKSLTDSIFINLNQVEFKENPALDVIEKNVSSGVKIVNNSMKKGMNVLKENTTETLKTIDTDIKPCIKNITDSILNKVEAVKTGEIDISDITESVIETLNNNLEILNDNIENSVKPKTEQLKNEVVNKTEKIKNEVVNKTEQLKNEVSNKTEKIKNEVSNKTEKIKNEVANKTEQLKTQVDDIKDNIKDSVNTLGTEIIPQIGNTIKDTVGDTIGGIASGIEKTSDVVKEKVIETIFNSDIVPAPIREIVNMSGENITSIMKKDKKDGKSDKSAKAFFKKQFKRVKVKLALGGAIITTLGGIVNILIGIPSVAFLLLVLSLAILYYFIYETYLKNTSCFRWFRSKKKKKEIELVDITE